MIRIVVEAVTHASRSMELFNRPAPPLKWSWRLREGLDEAGWALRGLSHILERLRSRFAKSLRKATATLLLLDVALCFAAIGSAYFLRFGVGINANVIDVMWLNAGLFAILASCALIGSGVYEADWRFPSMFDVVRIPRAVLAAGVAQLFIIHQFSAFEDSSRLALLIAMLASSAMTLGLRLAYRYEEILAQRGRSTRRRIEGLPILLIGAGSAADSYIRTLQRDERARFEAVALLAQNRPGEARAGAHVRGVPVLGGVRDLEHVIASLSRDGCIVRRLVFTDALSTLPEDDVSALLEAAERLGLNVGRAPRATDLLPPGEAAGAIQPIQVTDLLERPQIVLDRASVRSIITGRRVLVTGAGGSIGGELTSQLAALNPAALILLDNSEFNLFSVERRIVQQHPATPCIAAICDVRDRESVRALFHRQRPELVFHAAALKHVPLVEMNPIEGVLTNVAGTRNVADAAKEAGARAFVQVSTDKAVNTANVMGATKRIGELYCQALDIESARSGGGLRFMTVRFGNVLGTSGSLIPLFTEQLAQGGPLTVTDPEMRRFFMSIPEAVALTLQSSCFALREGRGQGRIFVLEMGEPLRIIDIARRMIFLAGLKPDHDVKIEITGARPGEKLFEELFDASEARDDLGISGVVCAIPSAVPLATLTDALTRLEGAARRRDGREMFGVIRNLLSDYHPSEAALRAVEEDRAHMAPRACA